MRKMLLLILLPLYCLAQNDTIPAKGVNTILIKTSLSDEEAYKAVGNYLLGAGYALDKTSPEFKSLTTARKTIKGGRCIYALNAVVNGGTLRLSGGFTNAALDNGNLYPIENKGQKGSPFKLAFEALDKAATDLKASISGSIQYVKQ